MGSWLGSPITATPEQGLDLAIKLARVGVMKTQPSDEVRGRLRAFYEEGANAVIATSQVVAINVQAIAAAMAIGASVPAMRQAHVRDARNGRDRV